MQYDSDSDSSTSTNDLIDFENSNQNIYKFYLVSCEIFNSNIHGFEPAMNQHFLTIFKYKKVFELNKIFMDILSYKQFLSSQNIFRKKHDFIRNYHFIFSQMKPEIAYVYYLPSGHCISIIKTFYFKILQRTWKNFCKKRFNILKQRSSYSALKYFEYNGKWPSSCNYWPTCKGILKF